MRHSILVDKKAVSKQVGGNIPDNAFRSQWNTDGLRQSKVQVGEVNIDTALSEDFTLVIKQNGGFAALLPELAQVLPVFAIVRNPLSVLASWNSCEIPTRNGRLPGGEALELELAQALASISDVYQRQLYILNWLFEKFTRHLRPENIVLYEKVIETGGSTLDRICSEASGLNEPLQSQNLNPLYSRTLLVELAERLLSSNGPIWDLYSKSSIEELLGKAHDDE